MPVQAYADTNGIPPGDEWARELERGIDEPDGWIVRMPDGGAVAAGPRARDALRLAREIGYGEGRKAFRAAAADLDAALLDLPAAAMGIDAGAAVPWWRGEPDR